MIQVREASVEEVYEVAKQIQEFENLYPVTEFEKRLQGKSLCLIAEEDDINIGFKCGYEQSEQEFYSWMGGVLFEYRQFGAARLLLESMEQWCKAQGYRNLSFKTLNRHRHMLIFAIKNGFNIVDVVSSMKDDQKRIVLQKAL